MIQFHSPQLDFDPYHTFEFDVEDNEGNTLVSMNEKDELVEDDQILNESVTKLKIKFKSGFNMGKYSGFKIDFECAGFEINEPNLGFNC